jgi:transposase InsO family protein
VATPPVVHGLTEQQHQERLQELLNRPAEQPRPRDPSWQAPQRLWEQEVRRLAVDFAAERRGLGVSQADAATLLRLPARTLRQWEHDVQVGRAALPFGRPPVHAAADEVQAVLGLLHGRTPWTGLPTLRLNFPEVPRAELQELLALYRFVWTEQHPRELQVLHWHRTGTVWAVDFTEARRLTGDGVRYVLAVRDLASGMQLAWQPVPDLTAAGARAELQMLFTVYGAPLVLKSDNGSAFRDGGWKGLLARWGVWPLSSPPRTPWYHGAIEAALGSLKTRTQFAAACGGHAQAWTCADLETARELANTSARPRGSLGPTPQAAWDERRPPSAAERESFAAWVRRQEATLRDARKLSPAVLLDHYEQAALHREVLTEALVEHGFLSFSRRRIHQRIFGRKAAMIT